MIYRCTQLRQSPTPPCVFPQGLDKTLIGDYLGEREDFSLKVTGGGGTAGEEDGGQVTGRFTIVPGPAAPP